MSAEGGSPFVLEDEFVSNFQDGWTVEVECTQTLRKSPTGYRGRWVMRCISGDGRIRTLATFRDRDKPREIRTLTGLGGFMHNELGAKVGPLVFEKGMVARFNRDGLLD